MNRVFIITGYRTPFIRAHTNFRDLSSFDLARSFLKEAITRLPVSDIGNLYFSNVLLDSRHPNLARELAISLNKNWNAHFVSNNCISGFLSITSAYDSIKSDSIEVAICGGVESMSNPPLHFSRSASKFFTDLATTRGIGGKIKQLLNFRPCFLFPEIPSPKEPSTGLTMGEHCELMVKEFNVTREEQDQLAFLSHQRAIEAKNFHISQIIPIEGVVDDNLPRADTSIEKLSRLRPAFKDDGTLTAGNSSSLTDGASMVMLASERFCEKNRIIPVAEILSYSYANLPIDEGLLMAPPLAIDNLLKRNDIKLEEIQKLEIHEAFAGQVLCNLVALNTGWRNYKLGHQKLMINNINLNGGSLALGHPFAATGGRLTTNLALQLKREEMGLASACAAGGMGCALLLKGV